MAYEYALDDKRYYPSVSPSGDMSYSQAYTGDARTAKLRNYLDYMDEQQAQADDPRTELSDIKARLSQILDQPETPNYDAQPRTIGRFLSELTSTLGPSDLVDFPKWIKSQIDSLTGADQMSDDEQTLSLAMGATTAPRTMAGKLASGLSGLRSGLQGLNPRLEQTVEKAGGGSKIFETLRNIIEPLTREDPAIQAQQKKLARAGLKTRTDASLLADQAQGAYGLDDATRSGLAEAFTLDKRLPRQILEEEGSTFDLGMKDPFDVKARANESAEYLVNKVLEVLKAPQISEVVDRLKRFQPSEVVGDLLPRYGQQIAKLGSDKLDQTADTIQDAGMWIAPKIQEAMKSLRNSGILEQSDPHWYSRTKGASRRRYNETGATPEAEVYWKDRAARKGEDEFFWPTTKKGEIKDSPELWQRDIGSEYLKGAKLSSAITESDVMKNLGLWWPELAALASLPFIPTVPTNEYQEKPGLSRRDINNPEGIPSSGGTQYRPNSWWEIVTGQ